MSWYQIKAAGKPRAADVLIYGDIGESWWGEETVTAKKLVQELAALDADEITVRVNSYGGAVADGLAIYNALRRHTASKAVVIEGVAVSIASLIAMAGDTVDMPANTLLMIHAPWSIAMGNAVDLRETADVLDRHAQAMASSYARKTGRPADEILPLLQDGADHWYTAAEALAAGFADTVSDDLQAAASIPDRYRPKGAPMPQKTPLPAGSTAPPAAVPAGNIVDIEAAREAARQETKAAEQARRRDIRALVTGNLATLAPVRAELDACLDDPDITAAMASQRILAALGQQATPLAAHSVTVGVEAEQKWVASGVQAILARAGKEKHDSANPMRGLNLREMARASLERAGISTTGMAPLQMAAEALRFRPLAYGQTSSDFGTLLEQALHKVLLMGWEAEPDTWNRWCRTGTVGNLLEYNRYITGTIGNISEVNEAGEYKRLTIPDGKKESVSAKRRGAIIGVTPEVIINDDLDFMMRVPADFGRGAKRAIEIAAIALLESNPTMKEDGKTLFHADHNNLGSGSGHVGVPSRSLIEEGRQAIGSQKDISGNDILSIVPSIWLGPLTMGATAREINGDTRYWPDPTKLESRVNTVANLFSDIIDSARFAATAWYMLADPDVHPTLEVVFLDGQMEPVLTDETEFSTSGRNWKVELPFGVGAVGWRGARKIPTT